MEKSALYNMDKNDVYRGSLLYYIDTGYEVDPNLTYQTPDKTNSVLKAYASSCKMTPSTAKSRRI